MSFRDMYSFRILYLMLARGPRTDFLKLLSVGKIGVMMVLD